MAVSIGVVDLNVTAIQNLTGTGQQIPHSLW